MFWQNIISKASKQSEAVKKVKAEVSIYFECVLLKILKLKSINIEIVKKG